MGKTEKLIKKLQNGSISASEVRTLLGQLGWVLARTKGSHETWKNNGQVIVIATHDKEIKPYLIRQIRAALEV